MSATDADRQWIRELVTGNETKKYVRLAWRGTCIGVAILCVVALGLWYEVEHPSRRIHATQGQGR